MMHKVKKISHRKCIRCRKDKQKCLPENRKWPGTRCHRCRHFDYACSENSTKAEERRDQLAMPSLPLHSIEQRSPTKCLQEIDDLRHLLRCLNEEKTAIGEANTLRIRSELETLLGLELGKIEKRAEEYRENEDWENAEYIYRRMLSWSPVELGKRSQVVNGDKALSHLALVYENMGDLSTAEVVQEALVLSLASNHPPDYQKVLLEVKKLLKLYALFKQRISNMGIKSQLNPSVCVLRRAAGLDIGVLNVNLIESDLMPKLHDIAGRSALHIAAGSNALNMTQLLIERGAADINAQDQGGQTALHQAIKNNNKLMVMLLLDKGAGINVQDKWGRTALHKAAKYGHEEIMQLLIGMGAEVDTKDDAKSTGLHHAAREGNVGVARLLVEAGSDPNSSDETGATPLHASVEGGHAGMLKLLLNTPKFQADATDRDGRTPLSFAAERGNDTLVRMLLNAPHVEADRMDRDGRTALSFAAEQGHNSVVKLLLDTERVEPNRMDRDRRTPLSFAAERGNDVVVKLLLDSPKVKADTASRDGRTPLSFAAERGHHYVMELLLNTCDAKGNKMNLNEHTPVLYATKQDCDTVPQLRPDAHKSDT